MTALLIDIGNSHARVIRADVKAGALREPVAGLLTEATPRDDEAARTFAEAVAGHGTTDAIAGVTSVVPAVTRALREALPAVRTVDHTWAFPFGYAVETPETVGADRWCNVTAAVAAGHRDAIVIDAGTATTIDVLVDGVFLGGLIAPGMAFAARKLQEEGARLWPVPFERTELRPGRHTAEALAIGAYHVGVHGVVGTVEALADGMPGVPIIATGGLAHHLARPRWQVDELWTLRGLAYLLTA
ncbi:type III pantothenate kinase [bacterium]|nr:type III pantothenate kinase [bacterium]